MSSCWPATLYGYIAVIMTVAFYLYGYKKGQITTSTFTTGTGIAFVASQACVLCICYLIFMGMCARNKVFAWLAFAFLFVMAGGSSWYMITDLMKKPAPAPETK